MADKLIRVNQEIHVMASEVISVRYVDCYTVYVETQGGTYALELGYNEPAYRAKDRFITEVNAVLQDAV